MATHPVLHPEVLSKCKDVIERTPTLPCHLPDTATGGSAKRCWAEALDALQGTCLTGIVAERETAAVAVLDPNLDMLPSTDTEHQRILSALASIQGLSPSLFDMLVAYVVGIVVVRRFSQDPSSLESLVDVRTATRDHWSPGMGRFVGSSTGHLGLLWIEAGLVEKDLVCGIVHEFVHLALNMIDMAAGVFTSAAYEGSLRAPSPVTPDARGRPYAMAMHALVVKSALGHLGLRMSTDPPGAFDDFHAFAQGLHAVEDEGLTVQGRALLAAVCAWERGEHEASGLQLLLCPSAVQRYAAAHAEPVLLFWSFGFRKENWHLCYEVADDGAVVFDGLKEMDVTHQSEYSPTIVELEVDTGKKPFSSPLKDVPSGGRLQHVRDIPNDFTVRVEDPWNTKFNDVSAKFDFVNIDERYGQSRLFLPNGQPHNGPIQGVFASQEEEPSKQACSSELSVAEVCGLPPPRAVQVLGGLTPDNIVELTCLGLDGGQLGSLRVTDSGTTLFRDVQASLATAVGTKAGLLKFVTRDGVLLDAAHGGTTIAELFLSSDERVLSLCS